MSTKNPIKSLPYIRRENFKLLFEGIKDSSFGQNIKNWLRTGKLIRLKRGLYISSEYYQNIINKEEYSAFLSSLLVSPSYISKETILNRYGILTESVFGFSSVTQGNTKNFITKVGNFSFSHIKKELFLGYKEQEFNGKKYYAATLAKALFDYLYFIKRNLKRINKTAVSELRINLENISEKDWLEFEGYLKISRSEKLRRIYKILRGKHAY